MCVIVIKREGVTMKRAALSDMWAANPHGAGFAYWHKSGRLVVRKGFLTCEQLIGALAKIPAAYEVVIHFRIATSGKINRHQTHPFILTNNPVDAKHARPRLTDDDAVLFHNGILRALGDERFSDTCELATILSRLTPDQRLLILQELDGKFVLMQGGNTTYFGDFDREGGSDKKAKDKDGKEIDDCEFLCSNRSWKWKASTVKGSGGFKNGTYHYSQGKWTNGNWERNDAPEPRAYRGLYEDWSKDDCPAVGWRNPDCTLPKKLDQAPAVVVENIDRSPEYASIVSDIGNHSNED